MASTTVVTLERFFASYPLRTYPKGHVIVFADEVPAQVFYIVSGRVKKYDISYRGFEVIVNVLKNPSFFPMSGVLDGARNDYFYAADTTVQVRLAPINDVKARIAQDPELLLELLARLYRSTEGVMGRMVQLMTGTARTRLVYELIIETRRFGRRQPDNEYFLDVSEADLAARAGMSRETVSREFSKLSREGLVKGVRGGILVLDLPGLTAKLTSPV